MSCVDLIEQVQYANAMISMFLMRANKDVSLDADVVEFSGSEIVASAIEVYPLSSNDQRKMIEIQIEENFTIVGPKVVYVHVLLSLLKNAIAFAHRGDEPWVGVRIKKNRDQGVISVSDRGPGIKREDLGRVFERFYSTSSAGEGFGIGLSFCKKVLEKAGGSVDVQSEPFVLTQFTVNFPR